MNKKLLLPVMLAVLVVAGLGLWFQARNGGGAAAGLTPTPPTVNFGKIFVGVMARGTASWTNNTNQPATVTGYGTDDTPPFGAPRGAFNQVIVQPGQTAPNFTFVFSPTGKGVVNGTGKLLILPPGPKAAKVNLTGEGVYNLASGALSVAPAAPLTGEFIDFGRVPVGQTKTVTVNVRNNQAQDLNVQGAWAFGNRGFARTAPAAAFAVPKNGETAVTLTFAPSAAGAASDVVIFVYPQSPLNSCGIYVKGEGVQG